MHRSLQWFPNHAQNVYTLSRRRHELHVEALSVCRTDLRQRIVDALVGDAHYSQIKDKLKHLNVDPRYGEYHLEGDALLTYRNRISIPGVADLRKAVMDEIHKAPYLGHSGSQKIITAARKQYFWCDDDWIFYYGNDQISALVQNCDNDHIGALDLTHHMKISLNDQIAQLLDAQIACNGNTGHLDRFQCSDVQFALDYHTNQPDLLLDHFQSLHMKSPAEFVQTILNDLAAEIDQI